MENIDLSSFSIGELNELRRNVESAIYSARKENKKKVRNEIVSLAKENGYELNELFPELPAKTIVKDKKKVDAKYCNPDNPEQTWSGRGMRPQWVAHWLNIGCDLDSLRIQ